MNLRQIKYFCKTLEFGSAAQAAAHLHVAPTAISMQITQLENHLGGLLFDRTTRPMALTALGRYFYPRALELLSQAQRLDHGARTFAAGRGGRIAIGFVRSVIFSFLPPVVRRFREAAPDVQFDLVEMLSEAQEQLLHSGQIQIGISRYFGRFDQAAGLRYTPLFEETFMAAVPINHPLAGLPSLTLAQLCEQPYISYPKDPQSPFSRKVLSMLETAGAAPQVAHEAIEIHTALGLVAAGLGCTLVGHSVATHNRSDVAFLTVSDLQATTIIVALTLAADPNPLTNAFVDMLLAQAALAPRPPDTTLPAP